MLPRFQPDNFPKNLEVVAKLKAIAEKYNATSGQIALAWIIAAHPNCECSHCSPLLVCL